jgi:uncharacterized protein (TIGR02145 family)
LQGLGDGVFKDRQVGHGLGQIIPGTELEGNNNIVAGAGTGNDYGRDDRKIIFNGPQELKAAYPGDLQVKNNKIWIFLKKKVEPFLPITGLTCSIPYTRYAWAYNACGNSTPVTLTQSTSACPFTCGEVVTDSRNGKSYNTIQIGTQCWFKENLNIGNKINGNQEQTNNSTIERYCYNDEELNCNTYGGLYQWAEMVQYLNGATNGTSWDPAPTGNVQGICPPGWNLPTDADWTAITTVLGGSDFAGGKMKSTGNIEAGTGLWYAPNTGATNESGFSAVPAGYRHHNGFFENISYFTYWWSSSEQTVNTAWPRNLGYNYSNIYGYGSLKLHGLSVRCLRDL